MGRVALILVLASIEQAHVRELVATRRAQDFTDKFADMQIFSIMNSTLLPSKVASLSLAQVRAKIARKEPAVASSSAASLAIAGNSTAGSGFVTKSTPPAGTEDIMNTKAHGTCPQAVQQNLRWNCDHSTADNICCFNRHFAEYSGYFETTSFLSQEDGAGSGGSPPVTFYDSVTGKPLFEAPIGRSWDEFVEESEHHGWPSFRDEEVVSENVRVLPNGETVSVDGTHLGHNLPDGNGNRYCINLVSVAGNPAR